MALIVYCIADAGSRVPLTGGPYAYVGAAFGPYAGFISGVLLWMIGTFAAAAVATLFAANVGRLCAGARRLGDGSRRSCVVALVFWSCGQHARRDAGGAPELRSRRSRS